MESAVTHKKVIYHEKKYEISKLNKLLILMFLANVIFIPSDTFHIKIVALLLLLICNAATILNPKSKDEKIVFAFGGLYTAFTIIWSILLTQNLANIRLGYPGFILLLYPVLKKYRIDFSYYFITLLKLLAIFIACMALLDFFKILDIVNNPILIWYSRSSNAMIGKGDSLPIHFMLFIKTAPLLFAALFFCLQKKQWVWSIIISASILLSGTRANIILLIFGWVVYLCFLNSNKNLRIGCLIVFAFLAIIILIDGRVIEFFVDMFTRKSSSDSVRAGHLKGIFEFWNKHPLKLIFGSGYSSEFYSYGLGEFTANIELSYWNLFRQLGLILFIPMLVMYLYPIFSLIKFKRNWLICFAYCLYLIIAYTNPFLYSSTGVTFLLYMYWLNFKNLKGSS